MRCPRRDEIGQRPDGEDVWRDNQTCSYCGSLNPDLLMAHLETGDIRLGATDKSYKVYVHGLPDRDFAKLYFQHFDAGHRARFIVLMQGVDARGIRTPPLQFEGDCGFYVLPFFVRRIPVTEQEAGA
jgi:hypothetical protein